MGYPFELPKFVLEGIEDYPELDDRAVDDLRTIYSDLEREMKICGCIIAAYEGRSATDGLLDARILNMKKITSNVAWRLANYLSIASGGRIAPEDATIRDVIENGYDIDKMPLLGFKNQQRLLFSEKTSESIVKALKEEFEIDYQKERVAILKKHEGLDTFIASTAMTDRGKRNLFSAMGNYNATLRDLTEWRVDVRELRGLNAKNRAVLLNALKESGVNYGDTR